MKTPFPPTLLLLFTVSSDAFRSPSLNTRSIFSRSSLREPAPTTPIIARTVVQSKSQAPTKTRLSMANSNPALALYEKVQDRLPSDKVVKVCDGKSVVASDVAAKAGISLAQARKDLTLLASLSQGDIAVSQDGDLIYKFPKDLSGVLSQKSSEYKLQQQFRKIWPTLFWGIRVGFGVALVASLVAIYSTIFFISSSSSSDDDRNERRGGGMGGGGFGGGFSYFWGPSPFDFFYYRPYGYYGYYGAETRRDPEELGFFESVYSYVFGDGDPNARLEERRLKLAAQMIRKNSGAVTAEQLAPFCDPDITPEQAMKSNFVDESFVLPIVTQLNGEPTVTDDGEIVYVFPELQTTAASPKSTKKAISPMADAAALTLKRAGLDKDAPTRDIQMLLNYNGISTRGAYERSDLLRILEKALPPLTSEEQAALEKESAVQDPTLLAEEEIKFSVATDFNKFLAGGLGVVNLGGALFLGNQLSQITAAGYTLPGIYGTVAGLYPLLFGYAILFNVIPLVRNAWLKGQNSAIQKRNAVRRKWRQALQGSVAPLLQKKLRAAKQMAVKRKRLGSNDVLYDTGSTTMEELGQQREQSDLNAFDKLLQQDDSKEKKITPSDDQNRGGSSPGAFE